MKKIIAAVLMAAFVMAGVPAVSADIPPSIAVIDNGTNTAYYASSIATEVCVSLATVALTARCLWKALGLQTCLQLQARISTTELK